MQRFSLVLAGLLAPALLSAQLPDPSPRALGMGDAYTSLARGYEAVAWNPAMLATWGRPGFTIGLPHVDVEFGSNSFGLSDVHRYSNSYLSAADKQSLLDKITGSDLTIRSLVGAEPFGLSVGPFALMVGASGEVNAGLGKDAVRLALFGDAPQNGTLSSFTAAGSNGFAWAATTAAGSFALPFRVPLGRLSVGVTYKYVIGNFLGSATDLGSQASFSPLFSETETGQAVYTNYGKGCSGFKPTGTGTCGGQAGKGYGVDLGGALQLAHGGITLSAVVVNALGSMTWDASRMAYDRTLRQGTQTSSGSVTDTTLSNVSLQGQAAIQGDAQARALNDSLLAHATFARLVRVGFALHRGLLTVAAQGQLRLKAGLDTQASQQLAVGAEYRLLGIVPLRAGASSDFAGATILSAGTGIQLLGINLDLSAANISGTTEPGVRLGFGLGLIF
jgi:hypothetical protein